MTTTSTGPRPASSFSPSCSCSAVKIFGTSGSAGGSGACGRPSNDGQWRLRRPLEREIVEARQARLVDHRPLHELRENVSRASRWAGQLKAQRADARLRRYAAVVTAAGGACVGAAPAEGLRRGSLDRRLALGRALLERRAQAAIAARQDQVVDRQLARFLMRHQLEAILQEVHVSPPQCAACDAPSGILAMIV